MNGNTILDLTHVHIPVVPAMHGVGEAIVPDDVRDAGDGDEERHDPRHPGERHDRSQESTGAIDMAPAEVSPIFSGDSSPDDP